jgi:hypothetical protein
VATDLGDIYAITVETRDEDGNLANTGSVEVVVRLPTGASMSSVPMALASTGRYEYDFPTTLAGLHSWEATAAGAVEGTYVDTFVVTSGNDVGIIGLQEARDHLRLSSTVDDELLRDDILAASDCCEEYTGRVWRRTVVTGELHDGGVDAVWPYRKPVQSITAVAVAGAALAADGYVLNTRLGALYRGTGTSSAYWPAGRQTVSLTYVAGPVGGIVTPSIRRGVRELVRHFWASRRGGTGLPRQGPDDEFLSVLGYSIPRRVVEHWDLVRVDGVA